ncbi:MAG TPA: hypothetical protein VEJ16_10175 [Alphaproteobacteria bacterium]|nr:hypothetical protein [Alphaproteobacteria bacterium]
MRMVAAVEAVLDQARLLVRLSDNGNTFFNSSARCSSTSRRRRW